MRSISINAIVLAIMLVPLAPALSAAETERKVSVTGTAVIMTVPDLIVWSLTTTRTWRI